MRCLALHWSRPWVLRSSCNPARIRASKAEPQVRPPQNWHTSEGGSAQHHLLLLPASRLRPRPVARPDPFKAAHPKGPGAEAWPRKASRVLFNQGVSPGPATGPGRAPGPLSARGLAPVHGQGVGEGDHRGRFHRLARPSGRQGRSTLAQIVRRPPPAGRGQMARLSPGSTVRGWPGPFLFGGGRPPPAAVVSGPQPPSPQSLQARSSSLPPPASRAHPATPRWLGPGWC